MELHAEAPGVALVEEDDLDAGDGVGDECDAWLVVGEGDEAEVDSGGDGWGGICGSGGMFMRRLLGSCCGLWWCRNLVTSHVLAGPVATGRHEVVDAAR